jgi:hypothetical protein
MINFLKDLLQPSDKDQNPHWRYTTGVAHAVLGACLVLLSVYLFSVAWILILAYVLLKEAFNDVYLKGGSIEDSIEDSVMVCTGFLVGSWLFFPLALLLPLVFLPEKK